MVLNILKLKRKMSKQIIRFNKNKNNFYLVKNRHYVEYKTREKEVIQIVNALMCIDTFFIATSSPHCRLSTNRPWGLLHVI